MTIRKIVKIGEELLRKRSLPILEFKNKIVPQLEIDLRETLISFRKKYDYGRGIAAVQIGELKRAIYVITNNFEGMLINPTITERSKEMFWTWDSCFSVDIAFFVKVLRYKSVMIEYEDNKGTKKYLFATEELSELLQHEIDHLDGKLFIDYIDKEKKLLVMKEVFEKLQD